MGPLAQLLPARLRDLDAKSFGRPLDVRESELALLVGDVLDLIEAGQASPDVRRVPEGRPSGWSAPGSGTSRS